MTTAHAPGASRALARDDDFVADAPAAGAWPVRARLWLRVRTRAAAARGKRALLTATAVALDKGIASLQALRMRAGAAEEQDARRERGLAGKRAATRRRKDEPPAEAATIVPKPRGRLGSLLVYLVMMLVGGMLGMAVTYDLLAQLLERRGAEIERKEAKLSGYSKSVKELKRALEQQQTERAAAEARLTASLAQSEKKIGELQAQPHPANAPAARAGDARPQQSARGAQGGWTRPGNCTLSGGDVRAVLAGCIADMNRQ